MTYFIKDETDVAVRYNNLTQYFGRAMAEVPVKQLGDYERNYRVEVSDSRTLK